MTVSFNRLWWPWGSVFHFVSLIPNTHSSHKQMPNEQKGISQDIIHMHGSTHTIICFIHLLLMKMCRIVLTYKFVINDKMSISISFILIFPGYSSPNCSKLLSCLWSTAISNSSYKQGNYNETTMLFIT